MRVFFLCVLVCVFLCALVCVFLCVLACVFLCPRVFIVCVFLSVFLSVFFCDGMFLCVCVDRCVNNRECSACVGTFMNAHIKCLRVSPIFLLFFVVV